MKKKCVLCLKGEIKIFVNLGNSPLANNLISSKDLNKKEKKYPLVLGKCKKCNHVQLHSLVKPKNMFDNYLYLSSASSTLEKHLHSQYQSSLIRNHQEQRTSDLSKTGFLEDVKES